jgi:hypothetical protein
MPPERRLRSAEKPKPSRNSRLGARVKAAWYGPVAGVFGLAFIIFAPVVLHCPPRGRLEALFACSMQANFVILDRSTLVAVVVAVGLALALQLVRSDPRYLVVLGLATCAVCTSAVFVLVMASRPIDWPFSTTRWLSDTLLLLPSGLLPLFAGSLRLVRHYRAPRIRVGDT